MVITGKIAQKKADAVYYSSKFNNNIPFFVLASYKNAVLTNNSTVVDELRQNGYSIVSSFTNGIETQY